MCGIVGYVGNHNATQRLLEGLQRLEYRGYDSAGVVTLSGHPVRTQLRRARGKVRALAEVVAVLPADGHIGLAHTRWATHGAPRVENAHPHHVDGITVVHNGIIENAELFREELRRNGRVFLSETDTEVIAHLVAMQPAGLPLLERVQRGLARLEGSWAVGILDETTPDRIVFARRGSPLVVGRGDDGVYLASDATAIAGNVREVLYLEDGDVGIVGARDIMVVDQHGLLVDRPWHTVGTLAAAVDRGNYKHFMRKEIDEQPRAIRDTALSAVVQDRVVMPGLDRAWLARANRIVIVACGSSYHAGMVGARVIEQEVGVDVSVELASEWRHRNARVDDRTLVLGISQSGETADTLGALDVALARGAGIAAITNVPGSAIVRACLPSAGAFVTSAGPELGVASTKAFITQIVALRTFSLAMAAAQGRLGLAEEQQAFQTLLAVADQVRVDDVQEASVRAIARKLHETRSMLYLGRDGHQPVALEGALKMAEVSYTHAQGFAAGEMKHGPIALIEKGTPVVVLAPRGPLQAKTLSNLEEVRARGAHIITVHEMDDRGVAALSADVLPVAPGGGLIEMALKMTVPLQLLAYHVADQRGLDVDQPRNLAKSVTVE